MPYPKVFEDLVQNFKNFPGIGDKTAERFVYTVDSLSKEDIDLFAKNLLNFKNKIKKCKECGILSDKVKCDLCTSNARDNSIICVVEDSKSAFIFEKSGNYNGKYHILDGLISPIEDINPEDINIYSLIKERINENVKEIIIALSPSIEGETTSLYIKKLLEGKNLKISRLSYGIPMGSDIEFLDPIMVSKALDDRKYLE